MNDIRIALAQVNVTVGALENNKRIIVDYIEQAKKNDADIVVFPELAVCGYPPEDLLFKKHFLEDNKTVVDELALLANDIVVVVGFADVDDSGDVYNSAAVLCDGKVAGIYHKRNLPNYGVFDEKRYFASGSEKKVFDLNGVLIGLNICEDIWMDCGICLEQAKAGADVLINISASPYHAGKSRERLSLVAERARECEAAVCYLNMCGGQDEVVFDGGSIVVGADGEVLAEGRHFEEDLLLVDIPVAADCGNFDEDSGFLKSVLDFQSRGERKSIEIKKSSVASGEAEVYQALVLGTRDYVRKNGFQKVVLGLSGGIDSALVAAIAVDALGRENVVGVTMPSRYSSSETKSDAELLAQNLGIEFHTLPIEDVYLSFEKTLADVFKGTEPGLAEENIQARARGVLLMSLSNKFGWMLLTTGNKSETAVGYCTLYGDMAGGFAVIKDVSKMMVYALSEYRNSISEADVIPQSTIDRAPSAELRADQKDSDSLPDYEVLDRILKMYVEQDMSFEEIVRSGEEADVVRHVLRLVDRNEYKRRQAPPGIKITPKSFGKDRRLPITQKYSSTPVS